MSGSLLTTCFWSDELTGIRSRSVSHALMHDTLEIPIPSARLTADWDREIASCGFEAGDIDTLPLARTIMRWPDYPQCATAVSAWMQTQGLSDLPGDSDIALMACIGTPYHHDAAQYGNAVFCNLFLSEDKGMDLHFPALGQRIPLSRGTVVIFDTAQPHAVIPRDSECFNLADFAAEQDYTQVFLTWELPVENAQLQAALQIGFDLDRAASTAVKEAALCLHGTPVSVCPETGRWLSAI